LACVALSLTHHEKQDSAKEDDWQEVEDNTEQSS
jgi:hypothetical protein